MILKFQLEKWFKPEAFIPLAENLGKRAIVTTFGLKPQGKRQFVPPQGSVIYNQEP